MISFAGFTTLRRTFLPFDFKLNKYFTLPLKGCYAFKIWNQEKKIKGLPTTSKKSIYDGSRIQASSLVLPFKHISNNGDLIVYQQSLSRSGHLSCWLTNVFIAMLLRIVYENKCQHITLLWSCLCFTHPPSVDCETSIPGSVLSTFVSQTPHTIIKICQINVQLNMAFLGTDFFNSV